MAAMPGVCFTYSSDELAEGYFEADEYSDTLKEQLERYAQLCSGKELTEEEMAERAELKIKFKNLSTDLSGAAREKFENIKRKGKRMIKIERKATPHTQEAIEDLQEASNAGRSYNTEHVNQALREVFHGKCYNWE